MNKELLCRCIRITCVRRGFLRRFITKKYRQTGATKKLIIIYILFDKVKDPTHEKETESDPKKNYRNY